MHFHIIAMAAIGKGLSGSDRIFIELSKNLHKKGHQGTVYLWEQGYKMCLSQDLTEVRFVIWKVGIIEKLGFIVNYIFRILSSIVHSLFLKLDNNSETVVYSASDFWMDSLPGWILKIRFPNITWAGTFYLAAPDPFSGFKEKGEKTFPSFKDSIYWLIQKVPYFLIKNYADLVCFTSEPDVDRFPKQKALNRYLIIKGGVNIKDFTPSTNSEKVYDAVFQGRFHKQKGVVELIHIWRKVVNKLPDAKLALIGDGPLYENVSQTIKDLDLYKNIVLFGYLFDGVKKNNIFRQSKIVVHPAVYDSGGMAAAEAMAFGLPGVGFDLEALKSYYPQGMLKAKLGDVDDFADKIINLLTNKKIYQELSKEARELIKSEWGWENRCNQFLNKINEIQNEKKE